MSSQTPNLNLVLPVGTEHVSRQIINDNNTKIDTAVGANSTAIANLNTTLGGTIAIVCDGDTHPYLSAYSYIYVTNNTHGLTDGLYQVGSSGRSVDSMITSSMCTAVSDGGLNALNTVSEASPTPESTSVDSISIKRVGKIAQLRINTKSSTYITTGTKLGTIPSGYRPNTSLFGQVFEYSNGKPLNGTVWIDGNGNIIYYGDTISVHFVMYMTYIVQQ